MADDSSIEETRSIQPDDWVLRTFGVELVAPLGGRQNKHWLVQRRQKRLVLRLWWQSADEIDYEVRLLERIAALGWPVASIVAGPLQYAGHSWTLAPFMPGEPPATGDPLAEQRARGRLLAAFHADMAQLGGFGQRGHWRRCEEILSDQTLDHTLSEHEAQRPEEVRILRWHLQRARERIIDLPLAARPSRVVHGDFTAWNLRFSDGQLCAILDFELAHQDHRIADFALSWRGKYDQVVYGYNEVTPLDEVEWALLTPLWWAQLIDDACRYMREGIEEDGWIQKKLLQRSPLMGPDAEAFH